MAAIRKRGAKWQARVKRNGLMLEKSFLTKSDAQRWARSAEIDIDRGVFSPPTDDGRLTLAAALEKYGREVTPQKRGAHIEHCRIRVLAKKPIAQKALAALRPIDVAAYRDERKKSGKAASTIAKELGLISAVFKTAIAEWGMEALSNPVVNVKKPRQPNGRERRLLPGEEELLLQVFSQSESSPPEARAVQLNPWIRPILIFAVETAMRRGEILNLKWENIDLDRRVAHLPMTKNGSSRSVPLSSRAVATLEHLPRSIDGRVFPMTANALKLAFKRGLKRARMIYETQTGGADPRVCIDLRFHDLRHEGTSRLAGTFAAHELAKITGHRDLAMLMRYFHPRAEDLAKKLG